MKKKIFIGTAACLIAAMSFVGINASKADSKGVTLSDLVMTSNANAECITSSIDALNTGGCSQLTGNCYWGAEYYTVKCDPYATQY